MITREQLQEMFQLQAQLEVHINGEDWREQGHDYALCVHMEAAEIIDALPWKHWKKGEPINEDMIIGEIVDIWHFAMAYLLLNPKLSIEEIHNIIVKAEEHITSDADVIHTCIGLSFSMYAQQQFPFGNFCNLMARFDLDWETLYLIYISKHTLNRFRRDNGYQDGTYRKTWSDGREDNEHLYELVKDGQVNGAAELYKALQLRYNLT